ncbi:hypothetical protein M0805_003738 [Coniferiporia weirii]|nr:hypothetical protein M0805_003738 [Coniferiporia weirii]
MQVESQRAAPVHTSRTRSTTVTASSTSPAAVSASAERDYAANAHTLRNATASASAHAHRAPSARSHQNLRTMHASSGSASVSLGRTASGTTISPVPAGSSIGAASAAQPSRSRSSSAARFLSVNTQAAASALPALPQVSMSANGLSGESRDGDTALTPTVASPPYLHSAPAAQGSSNAITNNAVPAGGPNGSQQRERSLTHKSSNRTVGGASTAASSSSRKISSTSTSTTTRGSGSAKDSSRTRERERRNRDKDRDRDNGRVGDADDEERDGYRGAPRMHLHDAEPAPPTLMYWSRTPVWGALPTHKMRSHSATFVDNTTIWLFGGCDDREFWRDVLCLDIETMEWTRPETIGDVPPPCRAHTATLVDRRLFVFGGGQGNMYYNTLYILDTVSRRWTHVPFSSPTSPPVSASNPTHAHTLSGSTGPTAQSFDAIAAVSGDSSGTEGEEETVPRPRRAHTAVLYKNRLVVFGGGNGAMALNDVWVLDVNVQPERMRWMRQRTTGSRPSPRGYHTANLVGNVMVVVGGSDGRQTFSDIFCLNLDTWRWSSVHADRTHRRLAHTATQIGSYLFITGGHDGSQYTNELLLFNLVSLQYEPRTTRGPPPSPRGYHASVLADGRLWVFGGYDGRSAHDDVHTLDLASSAYLFQVTGFYVSVD